MLTLHPSDGAGASGVARCEYSLDRGSSWTQGTSLTIYAPADHANDGAHIVEYRSIDNAGNEEAPSTCTVRIDTLGPVCAAKNTSVRRGYSCRLYFQVHDALSSKVTATVTVATRSGIVKKRWSWGYSKDHSGSRWTTYRCRLPKGTYLIRVTGKDLAGNRQGRIGTAYLHVK
jgi:hypothetical protein